MKKDEAGLLPEEPKNLIEQRTSKKVKFLGTQSFINAATGEIVEMSVTDIEERDFNFTKIWMRNFIASLELVGNQKTAVAFWVIDHLNKENQLIATLREMATEIGCSYQTVATTMKILQAADFLRRLHSGVYMVNPDILFKGGRNQRIALCTAYHSADYEQPEYSREEKIAMIKSSISDLRKKLRSLEAEEAIDVEVDPQLSFDQDGALYQAAAEPEPAKKRRTRRKKDDTD